jgi:cellobiose-specific phosphotransferase system component IIC
MLNDPQIVRVKRWLAKLNLIGGIFIGAAILFLVDRAFLYELPIILNILISIPVFILGALFGILLWKWTVGYILAFGVGIWWGHKTRNE